MSRTLIQGDKKAGFTIFWADDGLDTGPILLQRECDVGQNDTVDDLYNRFLFPEGIKAMVSLDVLNINILRGKEKHLVEFESKWNIDKMHTFGKTEVVVFSQILDFSGAVQLQDSWGGGLRIFVAGSGQSISCFHRSQEGRSVWNVALSTDFLNVFTRWNFLQAQREQKVRGEVEKKKGDGVFTSEPLWICFGFSMLVLFLLCFKMKKRKCIKSTQHGSLDNFFLSI